MNFEAISPANGYFYLQLPQDMAAGDEPLFLTVGGQDAPAAGAPIVLDTAARGSSRQLWRYDASTGVIALASDPTLALTCYEEPQGAPSPFQFILLANASKSNQSFEISGWVTYPALEPGGARKATVASLTLGVSLSVPGPGCAPGSAVTAAAFDGAAPDNSWTIVPARIAPGQWFCVQTQMSLTGSAPLVLSVQNGAAASGTPVVLGARTQQPETGIWTATPDQLWRFTFDGRIVSALASDLVLTAPTLADWVEENGVVTVSRIEHGNPFQHWSMGSDGVIRSVGLSEANGGPGYDLNVSGANNSPGAAVIAYPHSSGAVNAMWTVVPAGAPVGQWTTIDSTLQGDLSMYIDAGPDGMAPSGTAVTLALARPDQPGSLWRFTPEGHIVNAMNTSLALSAGYGGAVVACGLQPGGAAFQLWTAGPDGVILNQANGLALTVSAPAEGAAVTLASLQSDPASAGQGWSFGTGSALLTAMVQSVEPYPGTKHSSDRATSGQAAAYAYIDKALALGDALGVRGQYANRAAPLFGYQGAINALSIDPAVTPDDWRAVTRQLNVELMMAGAVQALFDQCAQLLDVLQRAAADTLAMLVPALSLNENVRIRVSLTDVFDGIVSSALRQGSGRMLELGADQTPSAIPAQLPLAATLPGVANLLRALFDQGLAVIGYNTPLSMQDTAWLRYGVFEGTIGAFRDVMAATFTASGLAIGRTVEAVLSDWSKLQRIYSMITQPRGAASLFWPAIPPASLATSLLPGLRLALLQALIPAAGIQVKRWSHEPRTDKNPGLLSPTCYVTHNQDGTQNRYESTADAVPMSLIWNSGGIPFDFFNGLSGWQQVPIVQQNLTGDTDVMVTFLNGGATPLTVQLTAVTGGWCDPLWRSTNLTVPPYDGATFAAAVEQRADSAVAQFDISQGDTQVCEGLLALMPNSPWALQINTAASSWTVSTFMPDSAPYWGCVWVAPQSTA